MSQRPASEVRARWWYLVGMAGTTVATLAFSTIALASVSSIDPSSGTVTPGGSTSATFTLTPPPLLTSCVAATVSPQPTQFSVSFDGLGLGMLPTNCAAQETEVEMTVDASSGAPPGDYEVTITEVSLTGGDLLSTRTWPFTVPPPPPTSTSTTTTTQPTTTTTASPTTTTTETSSATSTSSPPATSTTGASTTESEAATTTEPNGSSGGARTPPSDPTTTAAEEQTTTTGSEDETLLPPPPRSPGDGGEVLAAGEGRAFLTSIPFSESLRNRLAKTVPLPVAEAVLSPFVIAEFLFRSLLSSALGYVVPLLTAGVLGAWMVWQMRKEVTDDELAP